MFTATLSNNSKKSRFLENTLIDRFPLKVVNYLSICFAVIKANLTDNTCMVRDKNINLAVPERSKERSSPSAFTGGELLLLLLFHYVDCLKTFWAIFGIKADFVTLGKGLKSTALDGRMVDENIGTVVSCDKAKAFRVIEPLHCSLSHLFSLLAYKLKSQNEHDKKSHKAKSLCGLLNTKTSETSL
jgi:hypothetical protein